MQKGYIFDLDGTLLDSMGLWGQIDIDFLKKRGITPPRDYARAVAAMSFFETAEYTIKRFGLSETAQDLLDEWNAMAEYAYGHTVRLKPHAFAYLTALKAAGVKLGVATSLLKRLYTSALSNLRILSLFDTICSTEETGLGKTRPDIFLLAAERLGVEPRDCTVFEDILPAAQAAKSAGMTVFAVYDEASKADWEALRSLADGALYDFKDAPLP